MTLTPHAGRLMSYVATSMVTGAILGRVEVVVLGVAAAAVYGWKATRPLPSLTATVVAGADRVVEGEDVDVLVRLVAETDLD
ncbi:MAG TPA: hypothetical protein VNA20_02960, partial [Frankiaceae bacterium]|nr:hypothetical protein [Frankiaceae bacterium]